LLWANGDCIQDFLLPIDQNHEVVPINDHYFTSMKTLALSYLSYSSKDQELCTVVNPQVDIGLHSFLVEAMISLCQHCIALQ